jgi:methylglutaconyl-CoA hydratase
MILRTEADPHGVVTVTMNRPEKRNALNQELVVELTDVVNELSNDDNVRVIVITGAGDVFSAGADLKALEEMQTASYGDNLSDSQKLADLYMTIRRCAHPVIARVNGHAIAGGFGLVTACDFSVVDERARLGFTEVRIGFIPAIVMVLLRARLSDLMVRNLTLRGVLLTAREAQSIELVNRIVDGEHLDEAVKKLTDEIVRETSPAAVTATKRMIYDLQRPSMDEMLAVAVERNAQMRTTPECQAGIRAFLNREDPPWKTSFDARS